MAPTRGIVDTRAMKLTGPTPSVELVGDNAGVRGSALRMKGEGRGACEHGKQSCREGSWGRRDIRMEFEFDDMFKALDSARMASW